MGSHRCSNLQWSTHALSFSRFRGGGDLGELTLGLGELALWVFGIAYLAEALVGGPLHFELRRRGKTSLWAYSVIGVIAGVTPFFLYQLVAFLGSVGAVRQDHLVSIGDRLFRGESLARRAASCRPPYSGG